MKLRNRIQALEQRHRPAQRLIILEQIDGQYYQGPPGPPYRLIDPDQDTPLTAEQYAALERDPNTQIIVISYVAADPAQPDILQNGA